MSTTNPFDDPRGLVVELVDDTFNSNAPGAQPVHVCKKVRINGLDISRWLVDNSVSLSVGHKEATKVTVTFLVADIHTTDDEAGS